MHHYAADLAEEAYAEHGRWEAANPDWDTENQLIILRKRLFEDALTRLLNVEGVRERLEQLIAWAREKPQTRRLVVLGLDMDGFKSVNDSVGHAVGDEVLVEFSNHLESILRGDADIVLSLDVAFADAARPGGDEFLVLAGIDGEPPLDNTDTERRRVTKRSVDAKQRKFVKRVVESSARMLQDKTRQLRAKYREHPRIGHMRDLGVSVGVGQWAEGMTPAQLLRTADNAMYAVKRRKQEVREMVEKVKRLKSMVVEWDSLGAEQQQVLIVSAEVLGPLATQRMVREGLLEFIHAKERLARITEHGDPEVASLGYDGILKGRKH